jgi:hypothetical protein
VRATLSIWLLLASLIAAGCGGGSDSKESSIPGGADAEQVDVIQDWADDLRSGDVEAAADHFKLPSVAVNGTPPLALRTRGQVRAFNASLPCGAELTRAEPHAGFIIATFELTERPGPGDCGTGVGVTAQTAFLIEDGLIVEWRRVDGEPAADPSTESPVI